ncbi:unnamed protein product [Chondrus crispus]|uniref:Pantothenate kinase n=1 Tax=Chondrus crispus TaxID=2769 RepID=R7Q6T5_CHOCR|nr:unnamed protein product [Chondrus crispus]CDF33518.1 unnamed protein product [Chondrus crispus]|eukprot:XP_005713321.1 unnamed protein product [Chondrus crispus]
MSCTVAGLNFLLTTVKEEPAPDFARKFVDTTRHPFPYLLVNIGSGVSIVKVTGHGQFERVSGSSLGGGTFWGLARMLLDCATFDDVIRLTHDGDNANVDMLVGDIYGGAYSNLGLDSSVIAASFGKATMLIDPPELPNFSATFRQQDIALSLLRMVSYNIGQIAYLNARVHNLDRIYFGGNFIRNHPYTIADIGTVGRDEGGEQAQGGLERARGDGDGCDLDGVEGRDLRLSGSVCAGGVEDGREEIGERGGQLMLDRERQS